MNIEKWIGGLIALFFVDLVITMGNCLNWLTKIRIGKSRKLLDDFPSWAGTKKPVIWFIIWTIAVYSNFALYTLFSWLMVKKLGEPDDGWIYATAAIVFAVIVYLSILGIIYILIKRTLKNKQKN